MKVSLADLESDRPFKWIAAAAIVLLAGAIAVACAIYYARVSDPYIRSVLALEGSVANGEIIFNTNCAVCHGWRAGGQVGPNLARISARKSRARIVEQVVSGKTPPMPKFQPLPQEMADVLSYLETL